MPDYRIRIIIEGEDRASGPLRGVSSALGGMGQIAGGILGAGLFMKIANGLQGIIINSINATEGMQMMQVGMEGLIARELAQADAAALAADKNNKFAESTKTISDFMPQAQEKAASLMEELAKIAVLSPYQVETIQNTFKTAMAFGYTTDQAKKYTQALLNVAAGTGASNEMLGRMAYNFAQIRMQGRVTAVDIRQLAMAGFDLTSVLQYVGKQFGVTIKDHNDFNKGIEKGQITWDQFTEAFAKYADENFGGASERMARTLGGLKSTFKDLFALTMPKVLGPAVQAFTGFANKVLDAFLKIRDSGLLEKLGASLGKFFENIVTKAEPFLKFFDVFMGLLGESGPLSAKLGVVIYEAFGIEGERAFKKLWEQVMSVWNIFTSLWNLVQFLITGDFKGGIFGVFEDNPIILLLGLMRDYLVQIGQWVIEHIAPFIQFKDVLIALGIFLLVTLAPVLLSIVGSLIATAAPILLLIGIIALLRNAWEGNWFGIRDTLTEVWENKVRPALETLVLWLQTNIPIAIDKVKTYWDTVLKPALTELWAFLRDNVQPVIQAIVDVWIALIEKGWEVLVNVWNTSLQPALKDLWQWLSEKINPVLEDFKGWLLDVTGGVDGIKEALKKAAEWLGNLADEIKKLPGLPKWLTPGSPTPFEMGLRGIADAMREVSRASLPEFTAGIAHAGRSAGAAMSTYDQRQYNLNLTTTQSPNGVMQSFEVMKVLYGP